METRPTERGGAGAASPLTNESVAAAPAPQLQIVPGRVLFTLGTAIAFLALAHLLLHFVQARFGGLDRTLRLFELDEEANLPTWFSSITLFAAALISVVIGRLEHSRRPRETRFWMILAAGFVYLSIDELAMLHDKFGGTLATVLGVRAHGWITYVWVVPALVAIAAVGLLLLGFVRRLPRRVQRLSVLAGILYVGGAVGCEMISARLVAADGSRALTSMPYFIEVLAEETLEMSGVALWIYAQLIYLVEHVRPGELRVRLSSAARPARAAGSRRISAWPAEREVTGPAASPHG